MYFPLELVEPSTVAVKCSVSNISLAGQLAFRCIHAHCSAVIEHLIEEDSLIVVKLRKIHALFKAL